MAKWACKRDWFAHGHFNFVFNYLVTCSFKNIQFIRLGISRFGWDWVLWKYIHILAMNKRAITFWVFSRRLECLSELKLEIIPVIISNLYLLQFPNSVFLYFYMTTSYIMYHREIIPSGWMREVAEGGSRGYETLWARQSSGGILIQIQDRSIIGNDSAIYISSIKSHP